MWESNEPPTAATAPIGATHATTSHRMRPSRAYRAVPVAALGRIDGSVVPTAVSAEAPSALMPGVEMTAPPTPNAADRTPVTTPSPSVRTSRIAPGSTVPTFWRL